MSRFHTQSSSMYRVDGSASGVDFDAIIRSYASTKEKTKEPIAVSLLVEEQQIKDGMSVSTGAPDGDLDLFVIGCDNIGSGHSVALQGLLKTTGRLPGNTDPVLTRVYADPETTPSPDDPDYVDPTTSGSRELPAGSYVTIVYDSSQLAGYIEAYHPYGEPELIFCGVDTDEFPEFARRNEIPTIPLGCRPAIFGVCQKQPNKGGGKKK